MKKIFFEVELENLNLICNIQLLVKMLGVMYCLFLYSSFFYINSFSIITKITKIYKIDWFEIDNITIEHQM